MSDDALVITFQGATTKAGKPFVIVEVGGVPYGQLSPQEAALHGLRAIEASIEAERDAGLVAALREMKMEEELISGMVAEVRKHREQWGEK